jgi:hypothetical protein
MNSIIKAKVMTRVRTVHVLRNVFSTPVLSAAVFVLAAWGIGREVWVARVLQNEPPVTFADAYAVIHFYAYAFLDTRFIVQALSIVAIGALVWLGYSMVKNLQQPTSVLRFG